jgi:RNA polymerase sigma-70 factor (ECF subfamily)
MDDAPSVERAASAATSHENVERQDLGRILRTLLGRLPLEQRAAILLRELEGLTSAEIAEVSGVPAATVRSRIFYGLKSLRAMLPEYGLAPDGSDTGGTPP